MVAPADRTILIKALAEFHAAFHVPSFESLDKTERLALATLRATLISEETREVSAAVADYKATPTDEHRIHLAKELADLLYVTVGTAEVFRLPLVDPEHIGSPITPVTPDTCRGVLRAMYRRSAWVWEDLDAIAHMVDFGDPAGELAEQIDSLASSLQSLVRACALTAAMYRIPLMAVFIRVHDSNMSKINPATGEPEYRADGKVLKGPWYKEPKLDDIENFLQHPGLRIPAEEKAA